MEAKNNENLNTEGWMYFEYGSTEKIRRLIILYKV